MIFSRALILKARLFGKEGSRSRIQKSLLLNVLHRNNQNSLRGENSGKLAEKQPELFRSNRLPPAGGWVGAGERKRRQRSPESHAVQAPAARLPPLACLSAGPRGTDPGREKAPEERLDFPFAAGQGDEVLVLARLQLRPDRPGPAPRGCLGIQAGKGELSCWLEPAETDRTLRCQSHCSRPPGPLQGLSRAHTHTLPPTSSPGSRRCPRPP